MIIIIIVVWWQLYGCRIYLVCSIIIVCIICDMDGDDDDDDDEEKREICVYKNWIFINVDLLLFLIPLFFFYSVSSISTSLFFLITHIFTNVQFWISFHFITLHFKRFDTYQILHCTRNLKPLESWLLLRSVKSQRKYMYAYTHWFGVSNDHWSVIYICAMPSRRVHVTGDTRSTISMSMIR